MTTIRYESGCLTLLNDINWQTCQDVSISVINLSMVTELIQNFIDFFIPMFATLLQLLLLLSSVFQFREAIIEPCVLNNYFSCLLFLVRNIFIHPYSNSRKGLLNCEIAWNHFCIHTTKELSEWCIENAKSSFIHSLSLVYFMFC